MKSKFFGFYPPTAEEIESSWKEGIIVLDANALLNLYRYTSNTRDEFIKVLQSLADRLWLPFQAGYEFHKNRISVIKGNENAYKGLRNQIDEELSSIEKGLKKFKRHPFIQIEELLRDIEQSFSEIKKKLELQERDHPDFLKDDTILPQITSLYEGKTGNPFAEAELNKIYSEGKERYDKKIPPGYLDLKEKKDKDHQSLYGDLIIWKELINHTKKEKKKVIFVTDDVKDDWWEKYKGETTGPRQELIKEFYDETGGRILIYQADIFLRYAKEKLNANIKEDSIDEVQEVRKENQSSYYKLHEAFKTAPMPPILSSDSIKLFEALGKYLAESSSPPWVQALENFYRQNKEFSKMLKANNGSLFKNILEDKADDEADEDITNNSEEDTEKDE